MGLGHRIRGLFSLDTIKEHKLFLRWGFINSIAIVFFIILGTSGFFHGVHGPPLIASIIALCVTGGVSAYMGKLYWKANDLVKNSVDKILHNSLWAFFLVGILQIIGLLGAIFGYREITGATDIPDATKAVHAATLGLGNGLTATIIGVLGSVLIALLHFTLEHSLTKPE